MINHVTLADEELFFLVKNDDETAFNVLFERYRSKLYYYLLRHTKSPEIAEEIVIDIFMKLWQGRALADKITSPAAFFHKVGYYKAMDILRTTSRHSRLRQLYIDRLDTAGEDTPVDILMDCEARKLLQQAVQQLPPQRKLIYQMSREEGLTHDQIAEILNLSRSTVNNTIVSASRSIVQFLRESAPGRAALAFFIFFMSDSYYF